MAAMLWPFRRDSRFSFHPFLRYHFSTAAPKPFSAVPSKKGFRKYLDYLGPKTQEVFLKRIIELGPIYREKMMPFSPIPELLVASDPNDVETVFRADGKWPHRDPIPFLREIREKSMKLPAGIFLT